MGTCRAPGADRRLRPSMLDRCALAESRLGAADPAGRGSDAAERDPGRPVPSRTRRRWVILRPSAARPGITDAASEFWLCCGPAAPRSRTLARASARSTTPAPRPAALAELVAAGLVTSDGFAGLRAIPVGQADGRQPPATRRAARPSAGRWSMVDNVGEGPSRDEKAIDAQAWSLLRRYGVIFRRLLAREPTAVPNLPRADPRLPPSGGEGRDSGRPLRLRDVGEQFALLGRG